MENRICKMCKKDKPITSFPIIYRGGVINDKRKNICEYCRKNRFYLRIRLRFFESFNFKCSCCGEDDIRFLTLDHVMNDGFKDNKLTPLQLYRKAESENYDRTKWDCLCWNCNCAKGQNNGICPHKRESKEEYLLNVKELIKKLPVKGRGKIYTDEQKKDRQDMAQLIFKVKHGKLSQDKMLELIKTLQRE